MAPVNGEQQPPPYHQLHSTVGPLRAHTPDAENRGRRRVVALQRFPVAGREPPESADEQGEAGSGPRRDAEPATRDESISKNDYVIHY